jgi:hypothetical protein
VREPIRRFLSSGFAFWSDESAKDRNDIENFLQMCHASNNSLDYHENFLAKRFNHTCQRAFRLLWVLAPDRTLQFWPSLEREDTEFPLCESITEKVCAATVCYILVAGHFQLEPSSRARNACLDSGVTPARAIAVTSIVRRELKSLRELDGSSSKPEIHQFSDDIRIANRYERIASATFRAGEIANSLMEVEHWRTHENYEMFREFYCDCLEDVLRCVEGLDSQIGRTDFLQVARAAAGNKESLHLLKSSLFEPALERNHISESWMVSVWGEPILQLQKRTRSIAPHEYERLNAFLRLLNEVSLELRFEWCRKFLECEKNGRRFLQRILCRHIDHQKWFRTRFRVDLAMVICVSVASHTDEAKHLKDRVRTIKDYAWFGPAPPGCEHLERWIREHSHDW